jgi:pyruvate dehydrogenase E2 component (dihydrolipoamide acetyltransferase)
MAEIIRMPRLSDTMETGEIKTWLKKVGDKVKPGDILAEVETDKATMELESFHSGVLLYIGVESGPAAVNAILAVIGAEGEDFQAALAMAGGNGAMPAAAATPAATPEPVAASAEVAVTETAAADKRLKASPLAKSMAKEAGVTLEQVKGTGEQGRIIRRDVEAFIETAVTPAPAAAPSKPQPAVMSDGSAYEDIPVNQMRRTIARRLGESMFTAPHFYLTVPINMDKAVDTRKKINEVAPVKISFNDIVLKSVAVALRQHPAINSSWLGDVIRRNHHINIGVAVAVEDGLLVPVIRHADMKSLSQINGEVQTLAQKAKERKLGPDEMTGNTFTISNLGMFDIEEFTAIINPPDACILAVGTILQQPVVKDGAIVPGNIMKVTLSCDHRVVDGATAAKFLQTLKGILEDPIRLLI